MISGKEMVSEKQLISLHDQAVVDFEKYVSCTNFSIKVGHAETCAIESSSQSDENMEGLDCDSTLHLIL